nr:hypothetical protein [Tanacetum cinerariifolium]
EEEKKVEEVKDITGDAQVEGRKAEIQAEIYQIDMGHATKVLNKGKGIMEEEPKPMKKKQQVKLDEAYARKLHEELNQDIDWDVTIDHVKQKAKEDS